LTVAALIALAAPSAHAASKDGKALVHTPPGQAMVVSANLKAAFNNKYIRSSGGRMRLLVQRLLSHINRRGGLYRPDILLLQEALSRQLSPGNSPGDDLSATRVASELAKQTGDDYVVVVDPGHHQIPSPGVSKETAIVANLTTMDWPTAAGFIATNAKKKKLKFKHTGPKGGGRAPSRRQAWALIPERDPKGVTFPVASVHLLTDKRLGCTKGRPCQKQVNGLMAFWARLISDVLASESGDDFKRAVIGGDFNSTRRERFFGTMIGLGYQKAIRGRIDYIFSRGALGLSGIDDSVMDGPRAYPLGYSDHRFLWATVGP
jgi:hypothetical protein